MISMISTPNVTHVTHFQVRLRARTYGGYTAQMSHASRPAVPFCPGCGTYLAVHGRHRADCTAKPANTGGAA